MHRETLFNPKRFYWLIRNPILLNKSAIFFVSAAIGGILMFISAIDTFKGPSPGFYQKFYILVLYLGGFIVTSRIFKELHHSERGPAWLLLPASALEKFGSRLALSSVIYAVATMLMLLLFCLVSEAVNSLLLDRHHPLFNPFDPMILKGTLLYFVLQSPLLVGAVYFRKHVLSKTVLTLVAYTFVLLLFALLGMKLLLGSYLNGVTSSLEFLDNLQKVVGADFLPYLEGLGRLGVWTCRILFWAVLAPFFWTVGYYRLKEIER
jgi:hypothetical protein